MKFIPEAKKIFHLCLQTLKSFLQNVPRHLSNWYKSAKHFKESYTESASHVPARPLAHWILWTTLIFFGVLLIWAKFATLQEATVANATVIPVSHVQSIQNMEGGIIEKIYAQEGDFVQKGQILMQLDPTRFSSALDEAKARAASLDIKIGRLTAEVENKPFLPNMNPSDPSFTLVRNEQELFQTHQDQLKQIRENMRLTQRELTMTKPLVSQGAASEVEVLHLERQLVDFQNQIDDFYSHALADLESSKSDYSTLKASMSALQDRLNRTTIRSPVRGVVKQIRIATKEGVVTPGTEIMSVVPIEDSLLIEAQIKPSDIGFIHAGQPATVKITAYDYSIYGGLNGTVDEVSADTITNDKGESYYLVHIKTQKNYLRTKDNPLYIIPGMTASVNILTGKKTVLNYILSPLLKAKENAMQER